MAAVHPSLPRLAFGNAIARVSSDLDAFTAAQRSVMPAVTRYEPLSGRTGFRYRSATVRVGDILLVASASLPMAMAAKESSETSLLISFRGWSTSVIEGREYRWEAGGAAMLVPGSGRTGTSGVRSKLAITFNPRRLEAVARAMLGPRGRGRLELGLNRPRLIPIGASRSPALGLLKQALPLIDLGSCDEAGLRMLGVDDMLYRLVAVMLVPEVAASAFAVRPMSASAAAISRVTEHIVGHLTHPLPLSDLERVSGLSSRTLQLAFRKVHNCSPRQWIQRRRLAVVRERLLAADESVTVAAVALACGFTRRNTFAAAYERHYGELPSATLARARRG